MAEKDQEKAGQSAQADKADKVTTTRADRQEHAILETPYNSIEDMPKEQLTRGAKAEEIRQAGYHAYPPVETRDPALQRIYGQLQSARMNVHDDHADTVGAAIDSAIEAVEGMFEKLPDPAETSREELALVDRAKQPQ